jgi:plastocyanin
MVGHDRDMRKILLATSLSALLLLVPVSQAGSPTRSTVLVRDWNYSSATTTIKRGGTVTWVWRGRVPHDVNGGSSFHSTALTSGSWSHRFTRTGTFPYYCSFHAIMQGKVVVRSN